MQTIDILDWYDSRATLRLDMNQPVAAEFHNRYRLFIDIGCLEHVFDTRQCIENCLRMVAPGGHYVLCTPVSGWVGHGFHTFDPKGLVLALTLNGFEIVYQRYTTRGEGRIVERPKGDTLIWLVGRKLRPMNEFKIPQQDYWWGEVFGTGPRPSSTLMSASSARPTNLSPRERAPHADSVSDITDRKSAARRDSGIRSQCSFLARRMTLPVSLRTARSGPADWASATHL